MKALLLIITLFSFAQNDVDSLDWLVGTWTRTNAKPGRAGAEMWSKKSADEFVGRGVSLKGSDTTFVEKIRIVSKEGKLFYVADVPENKKEVWFEFTSQTQRGFVCENPKHDFPKKIVYDFDGTTLKATISGDGKAIDYLFVRKQ